MTRADEVHRALERIRAHVYAETHGHAQLLDWKQLAADAEVLRRILDTNFVSASMRVAEAGWLRKGQDPFDQFRQIPRMTINEIVQADAHIAIRLEEQRNSYRQFQEGT